MKTLIRHLSEIADLVIFDAPPLLAISDSLILAPLMQTVLYLTPIGFGSRKLARKGLELLRLVDSRPLGMVCNYVKRYDFEGYSYKY